MSFPTGLDDGRGLTPASRRSRWPVSFANLKLDHVRLDRPVPTGARWNTRREFLGANVFSTKRHMSRLNEMPRLETHIIPSDTPPTGFGEHSVPPVAPAVAIAVFVSTKKRLQRLPVNLTS